MELRLGTSVEMARTMAVNAIVVAEMFYLLNNRFLMAPVLNRIGLFGNRIALLTVVACVALQLAFTYAPAMNAFFGSTPLGYVEWIKAAGWVRWSSSLWRSRKPSCGDIGPGGERRATRVIAVQDIARQARRLPRVHSRDACCRRFFCPEDGRLGPTRRQSLVSHRSITRIRP